MTARHSKGTTGVLLLRINTAFSLPSHALYFLQSLVTLWEDAMSECELQQQGPAFCLSVLCLWPPPHSSSSDVFTPGNVLGPCWENSSHRGGCRHCPWPQQWHALRLFWEDHYSSCPVHVLVWKAREQDKGLGHSSASKIRSQYGVRLDISSRGRRQMARATMAASRWGRGIAHQNVRETSLRTNAALIMSWSFSSGWPGAFFFHCKLKIFPGFLSSESPEIIFWCFCICTKFSGARGAYSSWESISYLLLGLSPYPSHIIRNSFSPIPPFHTEHCLTELFRCFL